MKSIFAPVLLTVCLAACNQAAADHETLGDRAYVGHQYADALVEYRLALLQHTPNPRVRAKAGAAALRAGELDSATVQYRSLAREDSARSVEAAEGLQLVARAAAQSGDSEALRNAVGAMRQVAPSRALRLFGRQLAATLAERGRPRDALQVLPFAAASASDARVQDSLMFVYGTALVRADSCEQAIPVFESLLRRQREPAVQDDAGRQAASCALTLGRKALGANHPAEAEQWFRQAVTQEGESAVGRAAYVGLGDVRFAQGDFAGAAEAYQRAMVGAPAGDSIAALAAQKLNQVANAGTVVR